MTFEEYINQDWKEIALQPIFSVIISKWCVDNDLVHVSTPLHYKLAGRKYWTKTVSFIFHGTWFIYRTDSDDDGNLWTMDEHGNKKSRSVFKLIL